MTRTQWLRLVLGEAAWICLVAAVVIILAAWTNGLYAILAGISLGSVTVLQWISYSRKDK